MVNTGTNLLHGPNGTNDPNWQQIAVQRNETTQSISAAAYSISPLHGSHNEYGDPAWINNNIVIWNYSGNILELMLFKLSVRRVIRRSPGRGRSHGPADGGRRQSWLSGGDLFARCRRSCCTGEGQTMDRGRGAPPPRTLVLRTRLVDFFLKLCLYNTLAQLRYWIR